MNPDRSEKPSKNVLSSNLSISSLPVPNSSVSSTLSDSGLRTGAVSFSEVKRLSASKIVLITGVDIISESVSNPSGTSGKLSSPEIK